MNRLQIFRAGKHQAMSGKVLEFSSADVQQIVDSYDPDLKQAPLVKGHPLTDDPAHGWVASLSLGDNDVIEAEPTQVDAAFAEEVNAGRFKYISASLFQPDAPGNPKPGSYYLKHVGFLGAVAPAVTGLKAASFAEFADPEEGVESFAMQIGPVVADQGRTLSGVLRRLRDWFLEREGSEVADKVLPAYEIEWLRDNAAMAMVDDETGEDDTPMGFSQPESSTPEEDSGMSDQNTPGADDFAARQAKLDEREAKLKAREDQIAAREAAARQKDHENFAQAQADAGRYPAERAPMVAAILGALDGGEDVSFSVGDDTVSKAPSKAFRDFIENLPKLDFSEKSGAGEGSDTLLDPPSDITDAQGGTVDYAAAEKEITAYMKTNDCSRHDAILAIGDKLPG